MVHWPLGDVGTGSQEPAGDVGPEPRAMPYFSNVFVGYYHLVYYPERHTVSEGKRDTCAVEGNNAE